MTVNILKKNQNGVSLIELVIAVGIFTVLMLAVTSIFQNVVRSQQSAVAAQNTQESMRFVFEIISKEIRQAQNKGTCNGYGNSNRIFNTNAPTNNEIRFQNKNNECVRYYIDAFSKQLMINRDGTPLPVTPDDITVSNLQFSVTDNGVGALPNQLVQPRVTIRLTAENEGGKEELKQPVIVQTTISSRNYRL
jgi:prepilin-type N-terminal cleavage/methylation domain-containing protein